MVNPLPQFIQKIWSKWNIRGVILISLSLQIFLILFAPLRKRTRKGIVVFLLWTAYLLADLTANFCVGLISNKYGDNDTPISNIDDFVLAFWAPFLLLHLGGPDTISAFALEDNELWLRHLLGLIVQVCLTGYVFLLTLPANTLWIPTALVFVAGIIKFSERTRSLQLASISNFRQSMTHKPDAGPNYAKLMEEYKSREEAGLPTKIETMPEPADQTGITTFRQSSMGHDDKSKDKTKIEGSKESAADDSDTAKDQKEDLDDVEVVRKAHSYFNTFKGLVVDMIFSFHERNDSRNYFLKLSAVDALRVIEVELNFMYETFYTKMSLLRNTYGLLFRFVSVISIVAALVLFDIHQKHGCNKFDVRVTYTLLYGAVALDVLSLLMLIFSDGTFAFCNTPDSLKKYCVGGLGADSIFKIFLKLKRPKWAGPEREKETKSGLGAGSIFKIFLNLKRPKCADVFVRRWSGSISGFNLISYCVDRVAWDFPKIDKIVDYFGAMEFLDEWKYEKKHPLLQELWIFIFRELKRKSGDAEDIETIQRICSCRGAWVIQEGELLRPDINRLMPFVNASGVTFDQSLILWHIATDLLLYTDDGHDVAKAQDVNAQNVVLQRHDVETGVHHKNAQNVELQRHDVETGVHHKNADAQDVEKDAKLQREFSKLLSNYMLYLLIMQPTMMSAIRGIGQIRFQDTCAEAIKFFSKRDKIMAKDLEKNAIESFCEWLVSKAPGNNKQQKEACEKLNEQQKVACKKLKDVCTDLEPSAVKGDRSKSLLFDACRLANQLNELKTNKWKIIAQVWVELLSFAASNCRPITHVKQLSKGGEFISLVWLLMTHLGLGNQFQIKEGHARAKLIVGEENKSN